MATRKITDIWRRMAWRRMSNTRCSIQRPNADMQRTPFWFRTCTTIPERTIMYALWASIWTDVAPVTRSLFWGTGRKWLYTELSTARNVRSGGGYSSAVDRRTIIVNHRSDAFKKRARELLTSEHGMMHRSRRPIEPKAVFGEIKFNHGIKRFRLKSNGKVRVYFGLVALAHNLRKYSTILSGRIVGRSCCVLQ